MIPVFVSIGLMIFKKIHFFFILHVLQCLFNEVISFDTIFKMSSGKYV